MEGVSWAWRGEAASGKSKVRRFAFLAAWRCVKDLYWAMCGRERHAASSEGCLLGPVQLLSRLSGLMLYFDFDS